MKVPPLATAHLTFSSGPNEYEHILVRDGHVLQVLIPKWLIFGQNETSPEIEITDSKINDIIGLIETVVNTTDFTKTLTAFLVRRKNGDTLVPKVVRLTTFRVTCPTWERLIDEREIDITDWIDAPQRMGRWKNMDVEIWYGYDDTYLRFVQNTMVGLRALWQRNLDLNFKVLGHLIRDNDVVGIVMEPNGGRYIECCDRALAYNTFQELQKNNLVFTWPDFSISNLKIADGKVRFHTRSVQSIEDISHEHDPERLAAVRQDHWDFLESMLWKLDEMTRYCGSNPVEAMNLHNQRVARLLVHIPFPERPLLLDVQFSTDYHSSVIWSRHRRAITRKTRLPLLSKCNEDRDIERGRDDDAPHVPTGAVTLSRTSRRRQEHQYEPYWLPNTLRSSGRSDVSDATSATETESSTSKSPPLFAHITTS
ncbi:hypothetical protein IW261DRAFT_1488967 [Armillaria novae-zelandiae]|uniref:Uncharacterized protein n=1 Tax=Armillaria novae-zelandiae TaxID=153914 RepID=A0AA39P2N1_9AGAR|nr:hypothetical protein IW261DRAFT_1492479 [Armillaria novae-zelandiae]KAK0477146.1 hypothetical protein IW261DRAFT_1488967 [Armillaria novae-zelandiae]